LKKWSKKMLSFCILGPYHQMISIISGVQKMPSVFSQNPILDALTVEAAKLPIFLINLDRSSDRFAAAAEQITAAGLSFERIPAVDGKTLNIHERSFCDQQNAHRVTGREILPGEIGCYLSHRRALAAFLESGAPVGLILEDDVKLSPVSANMIHLLLELDYSNWYVANLGRPAKRYFSPVAGFPDLFRAHYFPVTSSSLLWTREGACRFLAESLPIIRPYDVFLQHWCIRNNFGLAFQHAPFGVTGASSLITESNLDDGAKQFQRQSRNGLRRPVDQIVNLFIAWKNSWRSF